MKKLTIIDTFGLFFRSYYALPYLKSKNGFPTGLLTGFINFVNSINTEHQSDYIIFALDSRSKTFRHEIDPTYKTNRKSPPENLIKQLPIAIKWIKDMGFHSISKNGYEADDIIASITKWAEKEDIFIKIITHDKDLYQLIQDNKVIIYDQVRKIEVDKMGCIDKFGIPPNQIADYLSIVGDTADNIKGVRGIGEKGAKKLLEQFNSLDEILENIDKIPNKRTQNLLKDSKDDAILSKKLVLLDETLLNNLKLSPPPENPLLNIQNELLYYGIKSVLKIKKEEVKDTLTDKLLDNKEKLFKIIDEIKEGQIVAFDTETTSLDSLNAKIVGFSFSFNINEGFYVPISHNYLGVEEQVNLNDSKEALKKLFSKAKIVGQNLKYDLAIIKNNFGLTDIKIEADTMIMSWLLNPTLLVSLDNMAKRYFDYEMVKFKDVVKKGEDFSTVSINQACKYASEDASITLKVYQFLLKKMDKNLWDKAKILEFPFINILLDMEEVGIKVDLDFFTKLRDKKQIKLKSLTDEIYDLAERSFNIKSPKQLGEILFNHLKLRVIKKTKTGYSTNEAVLEQLKNEHKIIPKILEFRGMQKLQSTYIEPLIRYGEKSKNQRVHTSFLQTGTATGRLSSKDPNLQNIPVRTKEGREIREGFIAKEGYSLLSVDYSQIELRLLAHFSKDKILLNAFKNGLDIHEQTAIKIFGEEAKGKRAIAKTINFGLLYGMGARKLSQTLEISQQEAKKYIDSYFNSFPTVKDYISKIHQEVQRVGYIETLLKRKRYFDFSSVNDFQKSGFLREALNSIFQGSSADLIKLSMLECSKLENENIKMLLQIHDELIFEIKSEFIKEFSQKIKNIMENIDEQYDVKLNIPLKVGISIGQNWAELK